MKTIQILLLTPMLMLLVSCGGNSDAVEEPQKQLKLNNTSAPAKAETVENSIDDPLSFKGIGPITTITLEEIDPAMAEEGREIFEANCTACHKLDKKFVGPMVRGVMERRSPEWVMNMILNPEEMIQKDALAKQVMVESNMAVMANQSLTEEQARKILEYFRTL